MRGVSSGALFHCGFNWKCRCMYKQIFPRSTHIEACIHEIGCFCEHFKVCIMHCLYAVVPHPLHYSAGFNWKTFSTKHPYRGVYSWNWLLLWALKKKSVLWQIACCPLSTVVSTENECLGGQISLKMTCIHISSGCFPFPGIPSGCFPFPATKKRVLTKSAAASQDLKVWCVRPLWLSAICCSRQKVWTTRFFCETCILGGLYMVTSQSAVI